jgi:hypothetical protein
MAYDAKSITTTFNVVELTFAIMLVGGPIAIPIIEEAQAANSLRFKEQGTARGL